MKHNLRDVSDNGQNWCSLSSAKMWELQECQWTIQCQEDPPWDSTYNFHSQSDKDNDSQLDDTIDVTVDIPQIFWK